MPPSDANEPDLSNATSVNGEVAAGRAVDPLADLAKQKLKREIDKLDREIEKLDADVKEAKRPYILRNPQTITAALATLGALITIGVATYTNYYGMLRDQARFSSDQAEDNLKKATVAQTAADAAQKAADAAKDQADQATKDAHAQEAKALEEQKAANQLSLRAKAQEKAALATIGADQRRVAQAELQANIANESAFKATRLPPYLNKLQPQLTSVNLVGTPTVAFGWLTSPTLRTLGVGSDGPGWPLENTALATVPASVNDLTIAGRGWTSSFIPADSKNDMLATLDMGAIETIGKIKRLRLLLGASELPLLTIQNLAQAKQLEDLDLEVKGQRIIGLEAIVKLPNLKRLRLVIDKPEVVPPAVLAMATSLVLGYSPAGGLFLSNDVTGQLALARKLESLEVTNYVDEPTIQQLKALPSLDTLIIGGIGLNPIGFNPTADTMPQIRSVGLKNGSPSDLKLLFAAFPNVRNLYVNMLLDTSQDSLQSCLDSLGAKYPHLRSLTLTASMKTKPSSPLKVPFLPELQALSLRVHTDGQQAAPIDLSSVNPSSLKWLELEAGALLPGQLGQLQALDTLMLNDPAGEWMRELKPLNKLRGLGINDPTAPCCDRAHTEEVWAREKKNVGPLQDFIANLPLERLYIPSYSIYLDAASRFPRTLRQIDLSSGEFKPGYNYGPLSPSLFSRGE